MTISHAVLLSIRSPDGSSQARFEALLAAHRGLVHKVAATYCAHTEDRRDLIQEIHTQMWRSFGRYDAERPFATWAYRVALNVAISHVRQAAYRSGRMESYDAQDTDPVDPGTISTDADDRVRLLYSVVAKLDPFDRALLLLHLEGYRHAEVADVLGLSATNVSTRLSRIRAQLQANLTSTDPNP
ncbi:MAG: sigma-70 family RNA polymerase sigma factor [Rubricoccaceae bacterium]